MGLGSSGRKLAVTTRGESMWRVGLGSRERKLAVTTRGGERGEMDWVVGEGN